MLEMTPIEMPVPWFELVRSVGGGIWAVTKAMASASPPLLAVLVIAAIYAARSQMPRRAKRRSGT